MAGKLASFQFEELLHAQAALTELMDSGKGGLRSCEIKITFRNSTGRSFSYKARTIDRL